MISFFRKIRRGLLTDNKLTKYLIYASGEIVLVVIGILIALQVNNGNETRKKEKTTIEILKQIQTDIISSVENADGALEIYREKDSLAYLVLSEKVTANDYLCNRDLVNLAQGYMPFYINDYGFNKLDEYQEYMPKGTEFLKKELYYLYTDIKKRVDHSNDALNDEVFRTIRMLKENKRWMWKSGFSHSLDSEALEYFLTDPIYKNYVESYSVVESYNFCFWIKEFRTNAINIYNEISEAIRSENSADAKTFPFYLNIDNFKNWKGKYGGNYDGKDYTIEITIENDTLFGIINNDSKREIFPLSDTKFYRDGEDGFFSLIMNENATIASIQYIHWQKCLICNRIE
jgi:hypothetical protein